MQAVKEDSYSLPLLADRFRGLLKSFNRAVIIEATTALESSSERDSGRVANGDLEKVIQKFNESDAKLRRWVSDLVYDNFALKLEFLSMLGINVSDVLYVVESCQMPVVEDLHRIFGLLETNFATLSTSSNLKSRNDREVWYASRKFSFSMDVMTFALAISGSHTTRLSMRLLKLLPSLLLGWMDKSRGFRSTSFP